MSRQQQHYCLNKKQDLHHIEIIFKLKARKTQCAPSFLFGGGVEPPTNFSKKGGLGTTSVFRGVVAGKEGVTFFQGVAMFLQKIN